MTFSDALPVRFWLNGEETFNEERPWNQQFKAFNQKFNTSDHIVIQSQSSDILDCILVIKNSDDTEVEEIAAIRELIEGIYFYSWDFTFLALALPEGCYTLEIYYTQIEGNGDVELPLLIINADGVVIESVEITGDGSIIIPLIIVAATGDSCNSAGMEAYEVILSNSFGTICGEASTTVYSNAGGLAPGSLIYNDICQDGLTLGFNYVLVVSSGEIFELNPATGQLGDTAGFC